MSAMLKHSAAATANKGPPSSFYSADKPNPVFQALDQQLKLYTAYMKKRVSPGYKPPSDEASSRPADTLFELWNKYEPRLPMTYYQRKVLETGDFLVSIREYHLALWQCYERYLKHFGDVNVEEITEVDAFKNIFFPLGFDTEDAGFTFRALMGKSICSYQVILSADPQLQNTESVTKCLQILTFLRLVTQVILPKETLCWLVYNGTIHIYSICRHLMSMGHSAKVLEFLLWAAMCMESSVPLLGVRYLSWRSTLYTAVCQCYYDCKAGNHAEAFARRALSKVNELSQLEDMSSSQDDPTTGSAFREATLRMAIMVYRRSVFETRRKPKGLLRPKTRSNLKEAKQLPWPRTPTEKLLADMFEGSAAQFLCIVETLSDSNRRTMLHCPSAAETEVEILDVYGELMLAAYEILAGGGGNVGNAPGGRSHTQVPAMAGINLDKSLMDMATRGEDGATVSGAVKLVKLAYSLEQWDAFDVLNENTMSLLKELNDPNHAADEKMIELMVAMDKAIPRVNRSRRLIQQTEEMSEGNPDAPTLPVPPTQQGHRAMNDELIQLAEVLVTIVNGPYLQEDMDMDMLMDACLFLWNKCKTVFQRYQTGSSDNPKYLQRMENPSKWVYILDVVNQALGWCGLSSVDPALTAEVVLRLSLVLEASAALELKQTNKALSAKSVGSNSRETEEDQSVTSASVKDVRSPYQRESRVYQSTSELGSRDASQMMTSHVSMFSASILNHGAREQLVQAREILEQGLKHVAFARQAVALTDGKSIADVGWAKDLNTEVFKPVTQSEQNAIQPNGEKIDPSKASDAVSVWNTIKDLHLELMFMYHRVCLKLAALDPGPKPPKLRRKVAGGDRRDAFDDLLTNCLSSPLSKALLYMQKALAQGIQEMPTAEQRKMLEDSLGLINKAQTEERRLYVENTIQPIKQTKKNSPPPPLLLCRTDTTMVFKPAPFTPEGDKVEWYRIFARTASGSNVKVRLNDYYLPGTGQQIPAFHCELRVSGLTPGEKYVFGVAAYTADGKLIGDNIGETTKPILASHPLPLLMAWAYLSQVSYQVGVYHIAKEACTTLWNHFVAEPPPPEEVTYITSVQKDFKLTLHRLNQKVVGLSSPVLLRMFLTSIFIHVDINVREGALFCDTLCDQGPLSKGQMNRLHQCERMLVALELAGWLNESSLALQAIVQCYGLLAPLIHFKIPAVPIIQVLERCMAILQEIPVGLRQRRQVAINESLHHMTACLTFHMAKVLRTWSQRSLANTLNEQGRKLLAVDAEVLKDPKAAEQPGKDKEEEDGPAIEATTETGALTLAALKKKKKKVGQGSVKEEVETTGNEELKALEAHMLRLSRQAQGEHELSGSEDPSILHAYIAYLPSRIAYKEVLKFKRRSRFLEFFVQVVQKALAEGLAEQALDWCEDTFTWVTKRNEQIVGNKAAISKQPGVLTVAGDDPKKFAAAMVEYNKDKDQAKGKGGNTGAKVQKHKSKKQKYKVLGIKPNMSEAQKQAQEEAELKALDTLALYLPDMIDNSKRRKRLRKISIDEGPWRCQLNIVEGLSQFGVFLNKLELREKALGSAGNFLYRTSFLDHEWFTFETVGTLIMDWEGGSRQQTREGVDPERRGSLIENIAPLPPSSKKEEQSQVMGIEIAAAAAVGNPPPPMFPIPREEEDTPRTYRSNMSTMRDKTQHPLAGGLITGGETAEMLSKTFAHFKKAIVLAHRGQYWTLLQNACRALWNCAHTALLRTCSGNQDGGLLTLETLRSLVWLPFHTAVDCLLDMMVQLQDEEERLMKKKDPDQKTGPPPVNSWMGGINDERGGASLKFEAPLDDMSAMDMRWMKRVTLRVLEVLYYEQKWERLVDTALRFNALSNDRYAELVNPMLVHGQRQLIARVAQYGGPPVPQPHYQQAIKELGPITAKKYVRLQLRVQVSDDDQLSQIDPGAHIDPEGHDAYSGATHALKLCSVPLDIGLSLQTLRKALDQSQYTSRGLQHSRRLLILYLAGQQNAPETILVRGPSRVDFKPTTARPQPTMPPDLSREEFMSDEDIQTSSLPRSQIGVVISSYEKTIEMLLASNQKGLAAEAMRELGNLHYHHADVRSAYKWWTNALDVILGITDAIHDWRNKLGNKEDIGAALLKKCGLWGCILGGMLASNIAQYVLTSDLGLRTESCFLSGYFFKALFRSSLPHPTADRDYALYEVGEGCEVTNLVPGVDLLSERFRADGRAVVSALRFVTEELARGRHNLYVLPLLTLYQFFTTFVSRDLQRSVDGRILKVRVLTDLGLFTEALITLQRLLHGERLPQTADSNFRQVESHMSSHKFNTSKPILDPTNLKVLEMVIDKRLSSNLGTLYGPHLTCHLSLVQAHLFIALADTLPVLPTFDDIAPPGTTGGGVHLQTASKQGTGRGMKASGPSTSRASNPPTLKLKPEDLHADGDSDSESVVVRGSKRFTDSKKGVTLEVVKGNLLATADQILSVLSDTVMESAEYYKGVQGMNASELELVVLCKLELAAIAHQRHHASMSARTMLTALKLLQNADVLKNKKSDRPTGRPSSMKGERTSRSTHQYHPSVKVVEAENTQYQFQDFQSRARLDARLWLTCRLALVKYMMGENRGMGQVKGSERSVKVELADVRQYCAEGIAEAEASGEIEMQAEFLLQAAILGLLEGSHVDEIIDLLKDVESLLGKVKQLSTPGQLLRTITDIHHIDLQAATTKTSGDQIVPDITLPQYTKAHTSLLNQLQELGEKIEHYYPLEGALSEELATIVSPIQNLYLPHLLLLVQVKLRIGHALARKVARQIREQGSIKDPVAQWTGPLGILMTALELCRVCVSRVASVEAEILLNMGKIQRQLTHLNRYYHRSAAATLLEAITTSYANDHDLGLIRQAYLEIALLYLASSGLVVMREGSFLDSAGESEDESSVSSKGSSKLKKSKKKWQSKKERAKARAAQEPEDEKEKERRAAWVAIRCAASVSDAQRARILLTGDVNVTSQLIGSKAQSSLPEFAVLDLVSDYVLGEKKRVYKNEIEEELAPLTEALEPPLVDTYDDQINKARAATQGLSWLHVVGYQHILQRLCSTATLTVPDDGKKNGATNAGDLGPEFDLGFISHAHLSSVLNHDVVRSVLFSAPWALRLNHLHAFLTEHLPVYATDCTAVYPPAALELPPLDGVQVTDVELIYKSYGTNITVPTPQSDGSIPAMPLPPGTQENVHKPSDKGVLTPADSELTLQWYQSSLDERDYSPLLPSGIYDRHLMLLYTITKRQDRTVASSTNAAMMWIILMPLVDLHDRLSVLTQRGEISLVEKEKDDSGPKGPKVTGLVTKAKRAQRIKALSPKVKKDEQLEALLRQCLTDTQKLFGVVPEQPEATPVVSDMDELQPPEIPFDVTKANLRNFEKLFDPTSGFMLKDPKMLAWLMKLFP